MDIEKFKDELKAFSDRIQDADKTMTNRTILTVFNFKKFRNEFRKIKNPRDRLLCIEKMIHANTAIANEQTMTIENTLHESK